MEKLMKRSWILIVLIFCGVLACGTENIPKKSGFLQDYSKLTKTPYKDAEGAYSYFNPERPLSQYSKFIVLPVQIRLVQSARAPYSGPSDPYINKEDLQKLADYFYFNLVKELNNSNYDVVHEPGPGTLILKVAITNLEPAHPIRRMKPTLTKSQIWGGASAEAELVDALTGEIVVAVIDYQRGRRYDKITQYGNVKDVIERWSKRLITRMDEAHSKAP
ncbi:MAG: DUF3313 domain-containing protein [Nitrospinaceae bacterium]